MKSKNSAPSLGLNPRLISSYTAVECTAAVIAKLAR